jgi:hypothetical protein
LKLELSEVYLTIKINTYMKYLIIAAIIIIPFLSVDAQGIGEFAPEKTPVVFPKNAFGMDLIFSEGGFGLGAFYRRTVSDDITLFTDFSISEAKDPQEISYVDYYGNSVTPGKVNRAFILPLNFGMQYRLFENVIFDNLRPYVNVAIGPSMVVTTPDSIEFFSSFGHAKARFTIGGYFGIGANFGLDKSSLVGLNIRYYIIHFFNQGIEILDQNLTNGRLQNDLGGIFITLNIGMMY